MKTFFKPRNYAGWSILMLLTFLVLPQLDKFSGIDYVWRIIVIVIFSIWSVDRILDGIVWKDEV